MLNFRHTNEYITYIHSIATMYLKVLSCLCERVLPSGIEPLYERILYAFTHLEFNIAHRVRFPHTISGSAPSYFLCVLVNVEPAVYLLRQYKAENRRYNKNYSHYSVPGKGKKKFSQMFCTTECTVFDVGIPSPI